MDLFSQHSAQSHSPLSEILRPKTIDQIIGQEKTIGASSRFGQMIRSGHIPSLILWGPPGTGKTTFAQILAQQSSAHFIALNAVDSGVKALREAGESGKDRRILHQQKTILFVDEIHRFNKGQQDSLLPYIEHGDLTLVGATTENPSYELNRALLSRCRILIFERLTKKDLRLVATRVEEYYARPLQQVLEVEAFEYLLNQSDGDARRLLNSFEIIYSAHQEGLAPFAIADLNELLQSQVIAYDKASDLHYDLISAFIKSVRGSDADAALYYMARILEGGEDPKFIARRLIILASEDIGNADPRALSLAVAGLQAVEAIGMPECGINLSQVVTYLASAPKSNRSYLAWKKAKDLVLKTHSLPVPTFLRSSQIAKTSGENESSQYLYPHDYPRAWVEQTYLPKDLKLNESLYEPSAYGFEKQIASYLQWLKGKITKNIEN